MTHKFYKQIVGGKVVGQRFGDSAPVPKKHGKGWVEASETDPDVVVFRNSVSVRYDDKGDVVESHASPIPPDGFTRVSKTDPKLVAFEQKMSEAFQR